MDEAVFLGRNGQQLGPYTRAQLDAMAARGELRADDFAWHDGLEQWQPAAAVLERLGIGPVAGPPGRHAPLHESGGPGPRSRRAAAVPGWMMGEVEQAALYEAFLGKATARYLPIFQRFDAGEGSTSWNLAAGLLTRLWMIYRGMYLWGLLWYPLLGLLAGFLVGAAFILAAGANGGSLSMVLFLPASIALTGLYGDRLYHRHARARIEESGRIGLGEPQRREWLARKGGAHPFAAALVLLFDLALVGLLAAVAVPAYQDYVIRSQVMEGVVVAGEAQHAVEGFYAARRYLPPDNAEAQLPAPAQLAGNYVQGVEVQGGAVIISFGVDADPHITGEVLAFQPSEAGGRLVWRCGGDGTTLQARYRPPGCR